MGVVVVVEPHVRVLGDVGALEPEVPRRTRCVEFGQNEAALINIIERKRPIPSVSDRPKPETLIIIIIYFLWGDSKVGHLRTSKRILTTLIVLTN